MTGIMALWLPIVLSAVIVFVASSVIHMATPWHKGDFEKLPDEDGVMDALRPFNIPPADYMVPRPGGMEEMKSAGYGEKRSKGPVIVMTVLPSGSFSMVGPMVKWFIYLVIIGIFAAYIAGRALPPGSDYLHVFRFVGVSAFIAHALGQWPARIWYQRSLATTIKATLDGLLYGLLTAGTFGWLWPKM